VLGRKRNSNQGNEKKESVEKRSLMKEGYGKGKMIRLLLLDLPSGVKQIYLNISVILNFQ